MTPREIVQELDKHIIGQAAAKRAVAIALRNRWRRMQVAEPLRQEITPKNILMIGPTGVGKTEIARRLANDKVLAGFAGGTADAFTLFERFEGKLEKYGNLTRAAIELAKDWRSDRYLRRLEALLLVGDPEKLFVISGNGDVIEPDHDVAAIGSGGQYALAAARALLESSSLDARSITERALNIAADICIYTNRNVVIEELHAARRAGA